MKEIKKIRSIFIKHKMLVAGAIFLMWYYLLPKIPYINLIISGYLSVLVWIITLILFGFKSKLYLLFGIVLLIIACVAMLLKNESLTEEIGNSAFLIIFTGTLIMVSKLIKTKP